MNKQQLATKIWKSANDMRSKIEANEYKDYILGFIFYKYLSDNEVKRLNEDGFTEDDIKNLVEDDEETVKYIRERIGYFIAYDNLFSTWLDMGQDFDVSNVTDALSAFNRLIHPTRKKVFEDILKTLATGLSKLGDSPASRTKAISSLIYLIKDIPMDGKQDYDVLGFIYEYLISMFAANAGKKAGEFYTPHEISLLMSEIVAYHLKDRKKINIYDPTSGSGSLLINIGQSIAKHIDDPNNIKYFAQELKPNTYNLTRMNLIMRGILPDNIVTRNGDTLEDDWPFFDETNKIETYNPLYVDAVVSNPPYSQDWDPSDKEADPRYSRFGLAPKSKADYAFLLHDLFHVKPNGIMTIVLPHGVLFRGGEEGEIRKNLIESNHIDAIIGLPANIFFGTGIPTIIMVLKQKRNNTDILIVDASKGFIKVGKDNKLRASDIKKIADTITLREDIPKYSRKVERKEIRTNDYNLNIPRYVDSSESSEKWDIYASMFGGIPINEIDELNEYWKAYPMLKDMLFADSETPYTELIANNFDDTVKNHTSVREFSSKYSRSFEGFNDFLKSELIDKMSEVKISNEKVILSEDIFSRLANIPLVDKYEAYQLLDDEWQKTSVDLEIIQTEGFESVKKVDPNMVIKKKNGKEQEVQDGWVGHIIPFELVQNTLLIDDYQELKEKENRFVEINVEYEELLDSFSEDERDSTLTNDSSDAFVAKAVKSKMKDIFMDITTPEITLLNEYAKLSKKADKLAFIDVNPTVNWTEMSTNKDGSTYGKAAINKYIARLHSEYMFPSETFEDTIARVSKLMYEEKDLKVQIKKEKLSLHNKTKNTIEALTDTQSLELLEQKWISPLVCNIMDIPNIVVNSLIDKVKTLSSKYETTFSDLENEIQETESNLSTLIHDLVGNEYDMKGLSELKKLLSGE